MTKDNKYYPRYIKHPMNSGVQTNPGDGDTLLSEAVDNDTVITSIHISGQGDIDIELVYNDGSGDTVITGYTLEAPGELTLETPLEEGGIRRIPGNSTVKILCDSATGAAEKFYVDIEAYELNCL